MSKKQSRREVEIKEWEERFPSVKTWFTEPEGKKPKSLSTKLTYIRHLKRWCRILGLNPDEIITCKDTDKIRGIMVDGLDKDTKVHDRSIHHKLHPFNSFLEANGREVKDPYGGIRDPIRRRILRLRKLRLEKLSPEEIEKLKKVANRLGKKNKPES